MGGDSAAMTLIMNQLQSAGAIPESYKTADSLSSDITKYGGIPTGVDSTASQSANSGTQTSSVSSGGGGGATYSQLNASVPASLSGTELTPSQQTTNLATKAVYGGDGAGVGSDEQKYFLALMNNRLVDSSGNLGSLSSVSPVENAYLSQLGVTGADTASLLNKLLQLYNS